MAEAFEQAAKAMFDVMTNVEKVKPVIFETADTSGHDESGLLYNWLETLLVKSEVQKMLFSDFRISQIESEVRNLRLRARIGGEHFDPLKHLQKVAVKAVTYHRMEIIRKHQEVTVKFILDI